MAPVFGFVGCKLNIPHLPRHQKHTHTPTDAGALCKTVRPILRQRLLQQLLETLTHRTVSLGPQFYSFGPRKVFFCYVNYSPCAPRVVVAAGVSSIVLLAILPFSNFALTAPGHIDRELLQTNTFYSLLEYSLYERTI